MPTIEQFTNNANAPLAADITDTDVALSVDNPLGGLFPTGNFRIILDDEIIWVGARTGNNFTSLLRGQEGTVAAAHTATTLVSHIISAASIETWTPVFKDGVLVATRRRQNYTGNGVAVTDNTGTGRADISIPGGDPRALTGATAATRYVGATASGAPVSGTFAVGDFVIAQNAHIFICTVAGTPGTWVDVTASIAAWPGTAKGSFAVGSGGPVNYATPANGASAAATGSGGFSGAVPAVIDGNDTTNINSGNTFSFCAVTVDLGVARSIASFRLKQDGYGTTWQLQHSSDNATWSAADATGPCQTQDLTQNLAGTVSARYWRFSMSGNGNSGWTIYTLELRSPGTLGGPVELAAGANGAVPTYDSTAANGVAAGGKEIVAPDFAPSGLTGATAASRYVGATATGAPASGTFAIGDFVVAQNGHIWICTVAGTPGTWVDASAGGGGGSTLAALTDVALASPTDGQALRYNAATSKWTNQTPGGASGSATSLFSGVHVYHNAAQTIPQNVVTAVAFNNERYDTDGYHDPATNNTRFTIPTGKAGWYRIGGNIRWAAAGSGGSRAVGIRLNGTTSLANNQQDLAGTYSMQVVCETYLNAGDYVELTAYQWQSPAASLDVSNNAQDSPEFWMSFAATSGLGAAGFHEEFLPANAATTITLAQVPTTVLAVTRNGTVQSVADGHYSLSGTTLTFTTAFDGTERVVVTYTINGAGSSGGALVKISEQVLTAAQASVTFSNIPQTGFRDLRLVISARGDAAVTEASIGLRFNGDTGANYDYQYISGLGSTPQTGEALAATAGFLASVPGSSAPAGVASQTVCDIAAYANTTFQKTAYAASAHKLATTTGNLRNVSTTNFWRSAVAITSLTLFLSSGNFVAGSVFTLYGVGDNQGGGGSLRDTFANRPAAGVNGRLFFASDTGTIYRDNGTGWDQVGTVGGATTTTVRLPLDIRNARSTTLSGNAFFTVTGLTAWDAGHWEFLHDVEGRLYAVVALPHNLAATPNAKLVLALAANATTGIARMTVATKAVANGASLNPATLTAETAIDVTVPATARQRLDVTFPATGNLAETVAADGLLLVEITHNGDHVNDTLVPNTELYSAWLQVDTVT